MNATPVITKLMNHTQKLSRLNFIPVLGFFTFFMISIFSQNPEKIEMILLQPAEYSDSNTQTR
jgi:hypothetical protein